jgi:hypothetical protein
MRRAGRRAAPRRASAHACRLSPSTPSPLAHPSIAHFVNLTNGLQAVPTLRAVGAPFSFARLPSTAVEQGRWGDVLLAADAGLVSAAVGGWTVVVWDCGSRGGVSTGDASDDAAPPLPPRALRVGLPFLRYALERKLWRAGGRDPAEPPGGWPRVRGHAAATAFDAALAAPDAAAALDRFRYWRRLASPEVERTGLRILGAHRRAEWDGDDAAARAAFAGAAAGGIGSVSADRPLTASPAPGDGELAAALREQGWWLWSEAAG